MQVVQQVHARVLLEHPAEIAPGLAQAVADHLHGEVRLHILFADQVNDLAGGSGIVRRDGVIAPVQPVKDLPEHRLQLFEGIAGLHLHAAGAGRPLFLQQLAHGKGQHAAGGLHPHVEEPFCPLQSALAGGCQLPHLFDAQLPGHIKVLGHQGVEVLLLDGGLHSRSAGRGATLCPGADSVLVYRARIHRHHFRLPEGLMKGPEGIAGGADTGPQFQIEVVPDKLHRVPADLRHLAGELRVVRPVEVQEEGIPVLQIGRVAGEPLPQQFRKNRGNDQSHLAAVPQIAVIAGEHGVVPRGTYQHHQIPGRGKIQIKHMQLPLQGLFIHEVSPEQLFHHQLLGLIGPMPVFPFQILVGRFLLLRGRTHPGLGGRRLTAMTRQLRCRAGGSRKQRFKSSHILSH